MSSDLEVQLRAARTSMRTFGANASAAAAARSTPTKESTEPSSDTLKAFARVLG